MGYDRETDVKARTSIEKCLSGESSVGIPWQSAAAFLRIVTNTRLPGDRYSVDEAVAIIDSWRRQPNVSLLAPGDRHWESLRRTLVEGQALGPMVTDAQMAALTMEHGGVLYTTDRDFARFPGLRWVNPLAAQKST